MLGIVFTALKTGFKNLCEYKFVNNNPNINVKNICLIVPDLY